MYVCCGLSYGLTIFKRFLIVIQSGYQPRHVHPSVLLPSVLSVCSLVSERVPLEEIFTKNYFENLLINSKFGQCRAKMAGTTN
jgi:hypothetical protein